jgi:iron complex outermembrane receptor protein
MVRGKHKLAWLSGGMAALGCMIPAAASAQTAEDAARQTDEIVVTAQRRAERLIDVPATVAVLDAQAISGASIASTFELAQLAPGLQVSNTGVYTSFVLRGVSSETSGPGAENNVAVYVDGVYYPSKSSGVFDFPDVESIEVLKGPQGTLYGRNATGGAILFKTAEPSFDPHARLSASYGSFDQKELKGTVSSGLASDVLAASLSGFFRQDDGYIKRVTTGKSVGGERSWLVRGKLLIAPADGVKVTLAGYYYDRRDRTTMAFTTYQGNSSGPLFDPNALTSTYGFDASNNPNYLINKTLGLSGKAEIETGIGDLTLLSAYTDIDNRVYVDGDNSSATGVDFLTVYPQKSFSQEAVLASRKFGAFSFIAGLSYYHDVGRLDPVIVYAGGVDILDIYAKVKTRAIAAYFDGNLDITDRLNLTAGVRWTTENKRIYGGYFAPTFPYVGKHRWNNVSPRAALRYALSDEANVYLSYTRGFKSGQFNPNNYAPGGEAVRPEIVDSFEGGVKARLGGGLSINIAGFHYNYRDIQVSTFADGTQVLQNAAKAKIYGLDAEIAYQPTADLTIRAAVSPLHARYSSFPNAVILVPTPAASCPAGRAFCGNQNADADLTGKRLPRAPDFSANASVNYALHAGDQTVNFFANVYHSGRFYWEISNRVAQKSYTVVNGRISWNIDSGPFSVELWGKNLTDSRYYVSQGIGVNVDGLLTARPRSWGVTLGAEF